MTSKLLRLGERSLDCRLNIMSLMWLVFSFSDEVNTTIIYNTFPKDSETKGKVLLELENINLLNIS